MEPPVPPDESDCCNSGCNPCILDVYQTLLKKYEENLERSRDLGVEKINAISPTTYTYFTLVDRKQLNETFFLFRFKYCDSKTKEPNCFQYKPGQFLLLRGKDHEGEFTRAYTPIPDENEDKVTFTIVVRLYDKGRMSKLLKRLKLGQKTHWRGPYGNFSVDYSYKYMLFIAQGVGIAPLYSLLDEILKDETKESFLHLFYCCRNSNDFLFRDKLFSWSAFWNFSYDVFLSKGNDPEARYKERIHENKLTSSDLSCYINGKGGQLRVIICGSDNFNNSIKKQVQELGIESKDIYLF